MTGKLTDKLIEKPTDKPTDILTINNIYENSGVNYFNDDLRHLIKNVVAELYYTHQELILNLRIYHIDRAIFKYNQAKERRNIYNTKQYFKSCIVSAIIELGFDELYFSD